HRRTSIQYRRDYLEVYTCARLRKPLICCGVSQNLEELAGEDESADENDQENGRDRRQILLDEGPNSRPEQLQQRDLEIEAHAARRDRGEDEDEEIELRGAARDRHELVGDRRQALDEDDPKPPLGVGELEVLVALRHAVEVDEPLPERLVKEIADRVAENPAEHRSRGADKSDRPAPVRPRQHHRYEERIGWNREERAFGEGHSAHRPHRMRLRGERDRLVVHAAEHETEGRRQRKEDRARKRATAERTRPRTLLAQAARCCILICPLTSVLCRLKLPRWRNR